MLRLIPLLLLAFFLYSCSGPREVREDVALVSEFHMPIIILDAGHGGEDLGATANGIVEKEGVLTTTLLTKKYLNQLGYRVVLTRDRDATVPLKRRVSIANRHESGLFVSIHFNSAPSKAAQGIEVFFCENRVSTGKSTISEKLASSILAKVLQQTDATTRGVKNASLHVIRETRIPAVLVEAGFITHIEESSKLKNREYLDKVARGIAQGIHAFLSNE